MIACLWKSSNKNGKIDDEGEKNRDAVAMSFTGWEGVESSEQVEEVNLENNKDNWSLVTREENNGKIRVWEAVERNASLSLW